MLYWEYEETIGPLMTTWGNWTLFLSSKGITAYRYTFRENLNLYFRLHYGAFAAADPHERLKDQVSDEIGSSIELQEARVRQFPVEELSSIEVVYYKALAHELILHRIVGDKVKYAVAVRRDINHIAETVKNIYRGLVTVKGF